MDCKITENYLREKARMTKPDETRSCSILCMDCPLSQFNNQEKVTCYKLQIHNPDKAISIVQQWSDEHPQKTYKDDFFEKFPNAEKSIFETPKACRQDVYGIQCKFRNIYHGCVECWNEAMPE